jgi:hypothetical protein
MELLEKAENIDGFFSAVHQSPINHSARSQLSYVPMNEYVESWLDDTNIVTMYPTAEAGMPHTRPPNLICMPAYFPEHARKETLAHEFVHIDQRRRKGLWNDFFRKEGWQPIDVTHLPQRLVQRCRLNPDTVDSRFWAWKGRSVPLPLFEREDKPELRRVVIHWYDVQTGIRQPEPPRLFLERYGMSPPQAEHPRELSAVEIAPHFQTLKDIDAYLTR